MNKILEESIGYSGNYLYFENLVKNEGHSSVKLSSYTIQQSLVSIVC